jgi:4,5-DOPA dioxygenase extradiol
LEEHIKKWDLPSLFAYEELAPNGKIAVPPQAKEHFLPLFYAMGAADRERITKTIHESLVMDLFPVNIYQFG